MTRVRLTEPPAALSERARKAFQLANQEAHRLNHSSVGMEHLLLGLAKEGQSAAATLLRQSGFGLAWLRCQVEAARPAGPPDAAFPGTLPYTDELEAFRADVVAAAEASGMLQLTPELLLLALAERTEGEVAQILRQRRLSWWRLRRRLQELG